MQESSSISFDQLGLPQPVLSALESLNFTQPTPIQAKTIPALLEGNDVLGEAQTGSGKTAAFGLPSLARVKLDEREAQVLVLTPTRELAIQVADALKDFSSNMRGLNIATLYGGQAYGPQMSALRRNPQIIVATPGRLMDHIRRGSVSLDTIHYCVLDEADEMLNMGFLEDIEWILEHVPEETQMALFSATMPAPIRRVTRKFLKDPVNVRVESSQKARPNITQKVWKVTGISKITALHRLAETMDYDAMLVFVRTRNDTLELAEQLEKQGFKAAALNGDMNQALRERTVDKLKNGHIDIMIATDVVARGLDVPRISHVLNYDLPADSESYVHRIGRTGRAGRSGEALIFARPREMYMMKRYEKSTSGSIEPMFLPTAEELGKHRVEHLKQELTRLQEAEGLEQMKTILSKMSEESEIAIEDLAAALLLQKQESRPLAPKPDPKPKRREEGQFDNRRDRGDRGDRRADGRRPERKERRRSAPEGVEWETYKLSVGRDHGARPGDIVGAIANEISLDAKFIGDIRLHQSHSLVQLPKGMPADVHSRLKKVKVRNKPIELSLCDDMPAREYRPRNNNGNGNGNGHGRGRGNGHGRRPQH